MSTESASLSTAPIEGRPFPHMVISEFMEPDRANALLVWLDTRGRWQYQESHFYEQYACLNIGGLVEQVATAPWIGSLISGLEQKFGNSLDNDRFYLAAHRLVPGQGIGIHNDDPTPHGTETHRLIVTLTSGVNDSDGGHLILYHRNDPAAIAQIVRPRHNAAAVFALSDRSFHAVTDVRAGVRYSLILSFWTVGAPYTVGRSAHGVKTTPADADERAGLSGWAGEAVNLLDAYGAGSVPHSGRSLLHHLVGVGALLERWDCELAVRLAGLCHSVYGTDGFHRVVFAASERSKVASIIGDEAERLAWLFGHAHRPDLFGSRFCNERPVRLRTGESAAVTPVDQVRLALMTFANTLEQRGRSPDDEAEAGYCRALARGFDDCLPAGLRMELAVGFT